MKTLIIAAFAISLTTPAFAEDALKDAFDTVGPGAAAAGLVGLGAQSIYKDGKAISAERKLIDTKTNRLIDENKLSDFDRLEKQRNAFLEKETKSARERWDAFEKKRMEMDAVRFKAESQLQESKRAITKAESDFYKKNRHAPNQAHWKSDPALSAARKNLADAEKRLKDLPFSRKYSYLREFELLKQAKADAESKYNRLFPKQSKDFYRLRAEIAQTNSSIIRGEEKIEKLARSMRIKIGLGVAAVAGGVAYLVGDAVTSPAVIESQNFTGKRAPAVVDMGFEKAELVSPVN